VWSILFGMTPFEWIQTVASLATAVGVGIAAWQLRLTKQQAQSQFEDSFTEQYRGIVGRLPFERFLDTLSKTRNSLNIFVRSTKYLDPSNEQAFLAARSRIREVTWANWREGIGQHLARPAFQQAWRALASYLDCSFDDLRRLLPITVRGER
jgi:hypothetical protein